MTTKKTLANQIARLLETYDITRSRKFDYRDIMSYMDTVANALAKQNYFENWKLDNKAVDSQFTVFWREVPVYYDNLRKEAYSILPAKYVALPENNGISFIGTNNEAFVPVPSNFKYMYANNPASGLLGQTGYYIDNDQDLKAFYTKNLVQAGATNVMMRLVIADSSVIDEDAPYPLPPDMENQLIKEVIALFIPQQEDGKQQ
jgi:hypothetical protein